MMSLRSAVWARYAFVVVMWVASSRGSAVAQSLAGLLGGFDVARLEKLDPPVWPDSAPRDVPVLIDQADELARLVYRVNRLSGGVLQDQLQSNATAVIGDAVRIEGTIEEIRAVAISPELASMLDLQQLTWLRIKTSDASSADVVVDRWPAAALIGDGFSVVGVLVETAAESPSQAMFVVGGRGRWSSANPSRPEYGVLASLGVDVGRLADVARLDRKPLTAADGDVFYAMIGAVNRFDDPEVAGVVSELPSPTRVQPLELLKSSRDLVGHWITIDLETVRWTKVEIQSPARRIEARSNAYYQIDAIGELGDVTLQLKTDDGDLITMSSRYPMSLVTPTLPEFLRDSDSSSVVGNASVGVRVQGFFYRLWSYESEFMDAYDGKQFAPLIVAAKIESMQPATQDPIGVRLIGRIAAIGVVLAIAATVLFHFVTRRGDRVAKSLREKSPPRLP